MTEEAPTARLRLFDTQISRKPNLYPWTDSFIKAMRDGHWTADEFDFESDVQDFHVTLTEQERTVVVNTLSAIGQIEVDVKLFWMRMGETLKHPSIIDLGITMANVESVHSDAYEKLLRVLGLTDVFQENLGKVDVIRDRVSYLKKHNEHVYGNSMKQYVYSLILFTLFVENVSLFSQFYVVLWFNRFQNVLKDTAQQVSYTKLEEQIHGMVGSKIINTIREEYPELFDQEMADRVVHEAKEAFKAESRIIDWILGGYSNGKLNSEALKGFVQQRINESLSDIGMPIIYEVSDDIRQQTLWMQEEIHANNMADFFYQRPVEYTKNSQVFSFNTVFASRLK